MTENKDDISYALSNFDIMDFFNDKINIVCYKDIHKFNSIDELLGKYNRCIILYESTKGNHWACILKPYDYILYFDSYGIKPENEFRFIAPKYRKEQQEGDLIKLLVNQPLKIHFSQYRLQKLKKGINTCGKWCSVISKLMINEDEFNDIIKDLRMTFKLKNDEIISLLYKILSKQII
jgi:hypothetical protein